MLSWRADRTVDHTLSSYAAENIFSLFDERQIFFQEMTRLDKEIAQKYGFEAEGNSRNIGIFGGIKALLEGMHSDYVLFLENDCVLIEKYEAVASQLQAAIQDIERGKAHVYRLRHRRQPGEDFPAIKKYLRYHRPTQDAWIEQNKVSAMLSGIRAFFRPEKFERLKSVAAYVEPFPDKLYPDVFTRTPQNNLIVSSRHINWTNQAVLFGRKWMIDDILSWVEAHPSKRTVNNFSDIEKELNSDWWRQQNYRIGLSPGLFTHRRLDR